MDCNPSRLRLALRSRTILLTALLTGLLVTGTALAHVPAHARPSKPDALPATGTGTPLQLAAPLQIAAASPNTAPASPSTAPAQTATSGASSQSGAMFAENFTRPMSPLVNATGGPASNPQAHNFGQANTSFGGAGKAFGDWLSGLPALGGVTNYADLQLFARSSESCPTSSRSCAFNAADNGGPHYTTNQVGQTTYHSLAVWVPAGGLNIPNAQHYLEIQELHFTNIFNGAPIRFELYPDHVTVQLDTGACVQGRYCAYHSDADHYPSHPAGSTLVSPLYAIPPGGLARGAWNEIVIAVNWETSPTGSIQTWYRTQGAPAWNTGSAITGIPTTQFTATRPTPPNTWNDGPEAYGSAVSSQTDLDLAGYADGATLASVAAYLP